MSIQTITSITLRPIRPDIIVSQALILNNECHLRKLKLVIVIQSFGDRYLRGHSFDIQVGAWFNYLFLLLFFFSIILFSVLLERYPGLKKYVYIRPGC